jgi:hypothetical protein
LLQAQAGARLANGIGAKPEQNDNQDNQQSGANAHNVPAK